MKDIIKVKIGAYTWSIRFLPRHLMTQDHYGTCWSLKQAIDIDAELDRNETEIILTHELTHAFLAVSGNVHREEYDEEAVCDFVAWNIEEIYAVKNKVLQARFG